LDIWQVIVLALVQGITEFLPISSSAHLILVPKLMGWDDQGVAFDVALHVGTLIAVLMYFRKDLFPLFKSWKKSIITRQLTDESRLVWGVGLGTIPVAILGLILSVSGIEDQMRSLLVIGFTTIFFGLLLGWADITGKRERDEYSLKWSDIAFVGLAQAFSLIPGTSRSGVTMTAALMLGLNRTAAARFSFLLSIPVIILAGADATLSLLLKGEASSASWSHLLLGVSVSAVSAYFCIHGLIKLLGYISMLPFVIYRLGLGIVLLSLTL